MPLTKRGKSLERAHGGKGNVFNFSHEFVTFWNIKVEISK